MTTKPTVLVVDDEPAALEGIALVHSSNYDIRTATSGEAGLALAREARDLAVVVSDMRMPQMDGATFLARMKDEHPETVRMLLTGYADTESAARAVNEGRIFRYLSKPCDAEKMTRHLAAAVDMHRLITAERVLLHNTLVGSVKAVVNVLGLTNPKALGRALRVRDRTQDAAARMSKDSPWGIEFAALLSQLAAIFLPAATSEKIYSGQPLSKGEHAQLALSIGDISGILRDIPRLEPVTATLDALAEMIHNHSEARELTAPACLDASLLHAIDRLESLELGGLSSKAALEELRRGDRAYAATTLAVLDEVVVGAASTSARTCAPDELVEGMVLAEDLETTDGLLLLPRGFELTRSTREHILMPLRKFLPAHVQVFVSKNEDTRSPSGES